MLNAVIPVNSIQTTSSTPSVSVVLYTFSPGDYVFGELDVQANNGAVMWAWKLALSARKNDADDPVLVGAREALFDDGDAEAEGWSAVVSIDSGKLILTVNGGSGTVYWDYVGKIKIQQPDPVE